MTGGGRGHGVFQVQEELREKNTLKMFMLKQLGKGLRSAIGAGRLGTCRKTALQI